MSGIRQWYSKEQWKERIVTFDASWFILTMGTGIVIQNLHYFPWPAQWLDRLSYVFWVANMVIFTFFVTMGSLRLLMYPRISLAIINDFQQTSFLGAIPISLDTLTTGLVIHYPDRTGAVYAAEVFYWIAVFLTVLVSFGGIFAIYQHEEQHKLNEVTGVWLLTFSPLIVSAALGSALASYLSSRNATAVIVVSFLMLSTGLGMCFMILGIYLWRLMACSLPARDAIVSCFVPAGPLGMGAFAILGLATELAELVSKTGFYFQGSSNADVGASDVAIIAQIIVWLGVISSLALLGLTSFFLLEAFASVFSRLPKEFNIGFWSFVFPCGAYGNALCRLSTSLRNDGLKGWAATWVVGTVLLWSMCATLTVYKVVWCGKLFVAPGLQGFVEQQQLDQLRHNLKDSEKALDSLDISNSSQECVKHTSRRRYNVSSDGTFSLEAFNNL